MHEIIDGHPITIHLAMAAPSTPPAPNAAALPPHHRQQQAQLPAAAPPPPPSTAVFYSISSTQKGLMGVDLGHLLIKRVAHTLLVG